MEAESKKALNEMKWDTHIFRKVFVFPQARSVHDSQWKAVLLEVKLLLYDIQRLGREKSKLRY